MHSGASNLICDRFHAVPVPADQIVVYVFLHQMPDGTRAEFVFQSPPVVAVHDEGNNFVAISNVAIHMYIIEDSKYVPHSHSAATPSWSKVCMSAYNGDLRVDGRKITDNTVHASTTSGLAFFFNISVSAASTGVRLRFCARRQSMDQSFSAETLVFIDSEPFDFTSSSYTPSLVLDRHPGMKGATELEQTGGIAGYAFVVQPSLHLVDLHGRNMTWCAEPYRLLGASAAGKHANVRGANHTYFVNSKTRYIVIACKLDFFPECPCMF